MESALLTTADGHRLDADVLDPDVTLEARPDVGGAVVCHPHPQYGGDRFNPVVDAVFRHLPTRGWSTLRFDFRQAFDDGTGERLDVVAALDALAARVDGPLVVVGYSFGAAVAMNTADERIAALVAIAPPLSMMHVEPPRRPTLVLTPAHDQFTPPGAAAAAVADWPDIELRTIEASDHFLVGRAAHVAMLAGDWLTARR